MHRYVRKGLVALGVLAGFAGLYALLRFTNPSSDDYIRYQQETDGTNVVTVISSSDFKIADLIFDKNGELVNDEFRFLYIDDFRLKDRWERPPLTSVVEATQRDFPLGMEFTRMLERARKYQKEFDPQ